MNKVVKLTLCFGMVCMLLADADTELPTNAAPIQLQESDTPRHVPESRALLYSQIPSSEAHSYACQFDSVYPFEADIVEDITADSIGWQIDSFVGYIRPWNGFSGWHLVPHVNFLVYEDSSIGSHPVDSPYVEIIVNAGTYETTAYGSGFLVGVPVSPPVNIGAGVTVWVELQPHHSFAANGQTGAQSEPGIGNGQEFFYRFPCLGHTRFQTASAGGWPGCEAGLEVYGGYWSNINEMPNEQINAFSFKVTSLNPISSRASFAFCMPHRGEVTFNIYDVSGQKVLDSKYSNMSQGEHTLFWDLKDNAHRNAASGIYLYRMETNTHHAEGKLVVVR